MTSNRIDQVAPARLQRAFTVVELLVAVSVMTLIVLVLYGLFDQVQKALHGNVAQVDVLEGGRATMQLCSGEMEQIAAGTVPGSTNLFIGLTAMPYQQALLTPGTNRVNVLQQIFFLSHFNKSWVGTGYRVLSLNSNGIATAVAEGVGTLCRYSVTVNDADFPNLPAAGPLRTNLFWQVMNWPPAPSPSNLTNYQQVMEGVIHFRVRAFDNSGLLITNSFVTNIPPGFLVA